MTDYRITIEETNDAAVTATVVVAHRDNLFAAMCVYLNTEIDNPNANVYLHEIEPETMLNRGYSLVRSSKIDRAA